MAEVTERDLRLYQAQNSSSLSSSLLIFGVTATARGKEIIGHREEFGKRQRNQELVAFDAGAGNATPSRRSNSTDYVASAVTLVFQTPCVTHHSWNGCGRPIKARLRHPGLGMMAGHTHNLRRPDRLEPCGRSSVDRSSCRSLRPALRLCCGASQPSAAGYCPTPSHLESDERQGRPLPSFAAASRLGHGKESRAQSIQRRGTGNGAEGLT